MSEPLDELYFTWLYSQVGTVRLKNPSRTHWSLLRQLFKKEFIWIVPNDDNRVGDGRDLRHEFLHEKELDDEVTVDWLELGCSMLEMLIGLSRRLSFEADGEPQNWFWTLLDNVGLEIFSDSLHTPEQEVDEILDRIIWRDRKSVV